MTGRLVSRNLNHRPIRTGLTVLAVAVEVAMVLIIVGLSDGLLEDSERRARGVGADILMRPSFTQGSERPTGADIPQAMLDRLPELFPEIEQTIGTTLVAEGGLLTTTGVNWAEFDRMAGGIRYIEGGPMRANYDAIVDEVYAEMNEVVVGDTVKLLNQDFRLVGIVESGKMSRVFIPLDTMQELMGWNGKLTQVYVKLHDSEQVDAVVEKIHAVPQLARFPTFAIERFLQQNAASVESMAGPFLNIIVVIAGVIGFLVVFLSMYTAVLERTREIGILKALGASKTWIMSVIFRETLAATALGVAAGLALGFTGKALIESYMPLLSVALSSGWMVNGAIIALVGSTLGTWYPANKAASQDALAALSYD